MVVEDDRAKVHLDAAAEEELLCLAETDDVTELEIVVLAEVEVSFPEDAVDGLAVVPPALTQSA